MQGRSQNSSDPLAVQNVAQFAAGAMPYTLRKHPQSHSGQGESTYNLKSVLMRRL